MNMMNIILLVGGLFVTVVMVGGAFYAVFKLLGGLKRAQQERDRLLREGIQASARITNVQMGGMTVTTGVHRHLQLRISLEVHPQGRPPYQALLTTMVSELQIPQLQPGVTVSVRYDANDPSKLALEGVGAPAAPAYGAPPQPGMPGAYGSPMGAPGMGVPGMGGMGAPGMGAPGMGAPGMPAPAAPGYSPQGFQAGAMIPVGGTPGMPAGAKIGLIVGVIGAVVGIGVAVVMVAVNVLGVGSDTSGNGVCAMAARCCETIGGPAQACKNYGRVGMPDSACQTALDGYRTAANSQGKTCN